MDPLVYTVDETARVTSLGKTRIYELINAGVLESRKVGKRRLVLAESVRKLVQEGY